MLQRGHKPAGCKCLLSGKFALLWLLIAVLPIVSVVGSPSGLGLLIALTLWLIYRIAPGWLRLLNKQPMNV